MKNQMQKANDARLQKALSQKVRYEGKVMTVQEMLETGGYKYPHTYTREYSEKRIQLEYKKLETPKTHYCLKREDGVYMEVGKLIYDHYAANTLILI